MTVKLRNTFLLLVLIFVGLCCILLYSYQLTSDYAHPVSVPPTVHRSQGFLRTDSSSMEESCSPQYVFPADIETSSVFPKLELEPNWLERREFWSSKYEDRYQKRKQLWSQLPLRVIVMPHSHNDPGWLKTVEGYFSTATKSILNNIVNKLTAHRNMTFIWSEMSYLNMWWESAQPEMRKKLRQLLTEGRLEITTGGWIMTDEANVEFFSMVDQLVEGHEFLRRQLGVQPTSSWSVDSFGHGGAFPHVLSLADISNMVIMRIHYSWKEWLARHQQGTFLWKQAWEEDGSKAPLCHNFPYDIYSIKHSCGPEPQTCLGFDFRHLAGEYNEFTPYYTPIDASNVKERAELLLEQYGRTGSLVPHNVVLVPLGDDFRYSSEIEFDQQYGNYIQLMDFINQGAYNAHVSFGTLTDYFNEVRDRMSKFPTLTGDFHVYSDIFSEGRPAYWSGYYFTRPYLKLLSRQLASRLRETEILYTLGMNAAKGKGTVSRDDTTSLPIAALTALFPQLEKARRALALFQHHDAITGTSKSFVMQDYENKLLNGMENVNRIQEILIQYLLSKDKDSMASDRQIILLNERNKGESLDWEIILNTKSTKSHSIIIYNSLPFEADRIVKLRVNHPDVCVYDGSENRLVSQVAPAFNVSRRPGHVDLSLFEVWFTTKLDPLSVSTFSVSECPPDAGESQPTKVYCLRCQAQSNSKSFLMLPMPSGAVQIENHLYRLLFDPDTMMLLNVTNKVDSMTMPVELEFAAYISEPFRSGAYLFSVSDLPEEEYGVPVFAGKKEVSDVYIVSGAVFSEMKVLWEVRDSGGVSTFIHALRLVHYAEALSEAIHIENEFDFGLSPNLRDRELFMRFRSAVKNGGKERVLYTDQAALGFVKRTWANQAGIVGNYFPITSSAYIEDDKSRITLLVDHATGASSRQEGWIEVMVDKRTLYDDGRGMGEGVLDSRPTRHRYTLIVEPRQRPSSLSPDRKSADENIPLPALSPVGGLLSQYLEHPPSVMLIKDINADDFISHLILLEASLPCDVELVNLRTWRPPTLSPGLRFHRGDDQQSDALLIVRRHSPDCRWASLSSTECLVSRSGPTDYRLSFADAPATLCPTTLTGYALADRSQGSCHHEPYLPLKLSPMEILSFNVTFH